MATKFYDMNFESKSVYLGDVGYFDENNYRAIRIDVSSVLSDYPGASFKVLMQRAGENHPYEKPAGEVTLSNHKLIAELTETDMNRQGMLKVQAVFEWGSVTGRSNTFIAYVGDSLSSDAGDPQSPYVDALKKIDEFLETGGGAISPEMIEDAVGNYLAENPIEESDPTVPAWAKAAEKPGYTADEVGAIAREGRNVQNANLAFGAVTTGILADKAVTADKIADGVIPAPYGLPIASADTLGGVKPVAKTDDMTQAVGVDIEGGLWALPGGGSGGNSGLRFLGKFELPEDATAFEISKDQDGNDIAVKRMLVLLYQTKSENSTVTTSYFPLYTNGSTEATLVKYTTNPYIRIMFEQTDNNRAICNYTDALNLTTYGFPVNGTRVFGAASPSEDGCLHSIKLSTGIGTFLWAAGSYVEIYGE